MQLFGRELPLFQGSSRLVKYYHPDIARVIVQRASSFTGKRAFGPATSFRKYLDHLNWTITPDGYISGQGLRSSTNCLQSPIKELVRDIKEAFGIFVYQQVSHRKGLTQVTWDIPSTTEVFSSFHSDEQAILANHILEDFKMKSKNQSGMMNPIISARCVIRLMCKGIGSWIANILKTFVINTKNP